MRKRVFVDASCWVAAIGSATGGSALILSAAKRGRIGLVATRAVLREAERAIGDKMGAAALARFYALLGDSDVELAAAPSEADDQMWQAVSSAKDGHVLAGAVLAGVDYLVSLDRRHILTASVRQACPVRVVDTKELIAELIRDEEGTCLP